MTLPPRHCCYRCYPRRFRTGPRAAERSLRFSLIARWAKTWLVIGMGMTEKQGGSDVMSNTTPQSVWTMVLIGWWGINGFSRAAKRCASGAGTDRGRFVLLFVPRFLPDGQRNAIRLERLKVSWVIALTPAAKWSFRMPLAVVGAGRGRNSSDPENGWDDAFDCALGSHAMMRRAFSLAISMHINAMFLVIH